MRAEHLRRWRTANRRRCPRRSASRTTRPTQSARNRWRICRCRWPQSLHGRDRVALAREMTGDCIGDADAADQQRGQGDQRQELAETLDIALELRRSLVARADVPAGIGESRCALAFFECDARRRRSRSMPAAAAGIASARGCRAAGGALARNASWLTRRRGPKPMPPDNRVRLTLEHGAQLDRCLADR